MKVHHAAIIKTIILIKFFPKDVLCSMRCRHRYSIAKMAQLLSPPLNGMLSYFDKQIMKTGRQLVSRISEPACCRGGSRRSDRFCKTIDCRINRLAKYPKADFSLLVALAIASASGISFFSSRSRT